MAERVGAATEARAEGADSGANSCAGLWCSYVRDPGVLPLCFSFTDFLPASLYFGNVLKVVC